MQFAMLDKRRYTHLMCTMRTILHSFLIVIIVKRKVVSHVIIVCLSNTCFLTYSSHVIFKHMLDKHLLLSITAMNFGILDKQAYLCFLDHVTKFVWQTLYFTNNSCEFWMFKKNNSALLIFIIRTIIHFLSFPMVTLVKIKIIYRIHKS